MSALDQLRRDKDEFFRSAESPLTAEQRTGFPGLQYFPENPALRFELDLDENVEHDQVTMQTSTGSLRQYTRAGKVHFAVDGKPVELTVFQDMHGYFLPFKDATGKAETYPAGRYLEPEQLENGKVIIDFNLAYNPYCAYNQRFSCPLPPRENWLEVRIEAGEKRFST